MGPFVAPGPYSATLAQRVAGVTSTLAGPVTFQVVLDKTGGLTLADHQARGAFVDKLQDIRRQLNGAVELATATGTKLDQIRRALDVTPAAPSTLGSRTRDLIRSLTLIQRELSGDRALGSRSDPQPASINERVNGIAGEQGRTLGRPTTTHQEQLRIAGELFATELAKLRQMVETDVPALEREVERSGAPYTTGRVPGRS